MRVIGTVGMPGSGKSEAATVAEAAGVPVLIMGDVIRQECRDRGLDPAQHHGRIAQALREENGPGAIAQRSLPVIEDHLADSDTVLVDGIRSDVEVETFREAFGEDFTLVHVFAPRDLRKERIESRDRPGDTDGEPLEAREERERGFGMEAAIDLADVRIENTGTLEEFHDAFRDLLVGEDAEEESNEAGEETATGVNGGD